VKLCEKLVAPLPCVSTALRSMLGAAHAEPRRPGVAEADAVARVELGRALVRSVLANTLSGAGGTTVLPSMVPVPAKL
jgi:hypothetical protein